LDFLTACSAGILLIRSMRILFLLLISTSTFAQTANNQHTPEEKAVLATVQALFDTMRDRDTTAAAALLLPDGMNFVAIDGRDSLMRWPNAAFVDQLKQPGVQARERMWDAEVRVRGKIAQVWAPYDLYVNGSFRHCGIDAFTLIFENNRWRITGAAFTVEKKDCPPGRPE
jgi:hypothetical protein